MNEAPRFPGGRWRSKGGSTFEVYYVSRYIALTGQLWRFSGSGTEPEERSEALRPLLSESNPQRLPAREPTGGRRAVSTEAMLALFRELGVLEGAGETGRSLVQCFLPKHEDQNPSLSIDPERGWYCHGCRQGGGAVRLRELVRELTDAELKAVSVRTGAPETRLFSLRERLRRDEAKRRA